jgi:hypothetical protein
MMCVDAQMPRVQGATERLYYTAQVGFSTGYRSSPSPCRQKKTPPERGLVYALLAQDFVV